MYSFLPALVAALFLSHGLYVLLTRGINRISGSYFLLCVTTICWQGSWAVLFQARDPELITSLVHWGYLLILFLPTSLYWLLVEISGRPSERRWVLLSLGAAVLLAGVHVGTNLLVAGHHLYFFGPYPKAGPLLALHVLQTAVVVARGLWVAWHAMRQSAGLQRMRLRICVASVLIYGMAGIDYLSNYGWSMYPPGVVFIGISLALIAIAVTRYQLMDPVAIAASVAHEIRTPLATIRMQTEMLIQWLPELERGYRAAQAGGLLGAAPPPSELDRLQWLTAAITRQIDRSSLAIELMLACARTERLDPVTMSECSMLACVREALSSYPFREGEGKHICVDIQSDFCFRGIELLMVFVLYNLIKNALYAIAAANKGSIRITTSCRNRCWTLTVRDTGSGIRACDLPYIFDTHFTTKTQRGAGLGLPFCRRVVKAFGGRIECESVEGSHTAFHLCFPSASRNLQPRNAELLWLSS